MLTTVEEDLLSGKTAFDLTSPDHPLLVCRATERLLNIKLEDHSSLESFIAEFESGIGIYDAAGTDMSSFQNFFSGCLIRAIGRSTLYRTEQNWIIDNPQETMETYFSKLRRRESLERMINGVPPPVSEDAGGYATSRKRSGHDGEVDHLGKKQKIEDKPWNIPRFPNSWKKMMSKEDFQYLVKWRKYYHGTTRKAGSWPGERR